MDPRRDALVRENLALVDHVVRRVSGNFPGHIDRQELTSAGRLGLTEAALRYDFDREIPFAPYAARRIRGAVLDLMRSQDWVPRKVRDVARDVATTTNKLQERLGRTPHDTEIASAMGIAVSDLRDSRVAVHHGRLEALDRTSHDERDPSDQLVDQTQMSIEELLENRELHGYLRSALAALPERLRLIVVGHYLEGRSLDELATTFAITPSRISQLKSDAIDIIRQGLEAQFATATETGRPKGRVAIRQARYASAIAEHADWRSRLQTAAPIRPVPAQPPMAQPLAAQGVHRSA
jgi:RNA polymerase sigma factor for flagellar operon FliA